MAKSSSSRIAQLARSRIDVDCYIKWLRLRSDPEYLRESEKIRKLRDTACKAIERANGANAIYKSLLESDSPSNKKQIAKQECWIAEVFARDMQQVCVEEEEKTCEKFGISQWWPPEDNNLGMVNARYIFEPLPPIQIIPPPLKMQIDLNAEGNKRMWQDLLHGDSVVEPPQKYTMADKDGWLTIKVNLHAPLDELEEAMRRELRRHRYFQPAGRNRPDKDAEALEAWECYEREKRFSLVARNLRRKLTTVKNQYVRACIIIYGKQPSGTIKQRRAGMISDPAVWFQTHQGSCGRCQKADRTEDMCAPAYVYVTQDAKALRERLDSI